MPTSEYNKIFGFRKSTIPNAKDLKDGIQEFLESNERCNFQQSLEWGRVKQAWKNEIILSKDKDGKIQEKWIQCNDQNVSEETDESIKKEVIPSGCYYLYERQ